MRKVYDLISLTNKYKGFTIRHINDGEILDFNGLYIVEELYTDFIGNNVVLVDEVEIVSVTNTLHK